LLTPAEFESVLAHEYAHVSARHGRFGAWIYRTRGTWLLLFDRLQAPPTSGISRSLRTLLGKFVDWYWPRFHAYFFVMSRAHEFAADRAAVEWAGADATASALWKIDVGARRLDERFWPEVWREANTALEPPEGITGRMREFLAVPASAADVNNWSRQVASCVTDNSDTHPSLSDRLASYGGSLAACEAIGCPVPASPSAAEQLFGMRLDGIRSAVDRSWREEVADHWRARHHRIGTVQRRASELDQAPARPELSVTTLWEKACTILDLQGPEAAEPLLLEILSLRPQHPAANLTLGRHWLGQGRTDGEAYLRRILDQPECELVPEACQALAHHFQTTGQSQELRKVYDFLGRYQTAQSEAVRERSSVTALDNLLPHGLSSMDLAALSTILAKDTDLAEAYLVRKELKHLTHQPLYVLCVRTRPGFFGRSNAGNDAQLVARLFSQVRLSGRVLVIAPQGGFRPLARKVMASADAKVHPPTGSASTS
jgi:Peptidase family M48